MARFAAGIALFIYKQNKPELEILRDGIKKKKSV